MLKNVAIRVDASVLIGSGHVMRCLNLADMLRECGCDVIFICRDYPGNLINMIKKRGYNVSILEFKDHIAYQSQMISDDYAKWLWYTQEQDVSDTKKVVNNLVLDLLVIDHYSLDIVWETQFRQYVKKIMIIDDLANRKHDCDYLLDQNYYVSGLARYNTLVPKQAKLFLGPEYFLFSKQFIQQAKNIRQRTALKKVFIFFGGADPKNYTFEILKIVEQFPELEFNIVVGALNVNASLIKRVVLEKSNCRYHYNIDYMAMLINECDIGIGAGGVNTWERILLKLPSLVYATAINQVNACLDLDKVGLINYLDQKIEFLELKNKLLNYQNSYIMQTSYLTNSKFEIINFISDIVL